VQKIFVDNEKIENAGDKGLGVLWKFPGGYGDLHFTVVNGEGVTAKEKTGFDGRFKDFMGRVTMVPFPKNESLSGLKIHAFVHRGQVEGGPFQARHRMIGAVSYQAASYYLMASYVAGQDGNGAADVDVTGYSIHGSLQVLQDVNVFGRMDGYKKSTTEYNRYTVGVDHTLAEGVRVSINDQVVVPTSGKTYENQMLAQVELKF